MIQGDRVRFESIERQPDLSIREEGPDPCAEGYRKTEVLEDVDDVDDVNVVEEP